MARWPSGLRGRGIGQDVADAELVLAATAAVVGGGEGGDVGGQEGETRKTGEEKKCDEHVGSGKDAGSVPNVAAEEHPYDFRVCGPRNLSSPNWRDLFRSSWKDPNYKRMVIACFIQGVYLLELDRQENKTEENGLAPKWWKPFKYKLVHMLVDERDGSIYGAILEWGRAAALSKFIVMRPGGAPRAVLALRGTLLRSPTIRRDLEDDLRFLAWESLRGSVRFHGALVALKTLVDRHGSDSVCGWAFPRCWVCSASGQDNGEGRRLRRVSLIQSPICLVGNEPEEHRREGRPGMEEAQSCPPCEWRRALAENRR